MPKYFLNRICLYQDEPIIMILTSVLSLRSFNREFTRFEKKHYPWSDLTNKNSPTPQPFQLPSARRPSPSESATAATAETAETTAAETTAAIPWTSSSAHGRK
jgi:hypothetical protein